MAAKADTSPPAPDLPAAGVGCGVGVLGRIAGCSTASRLSTTILATGARTCPGQRTKKRKTPKRVARRSEDRQLASRAQNAINACDRDTATLPAMPYMANCQSRALHAQVQPWCRIISREGRIQSAGRAVPTHRKTIEGYEPSFSLIRADSRHASKGDSYVRRTFLTAPSQH